MKKQWMFYTLALLITLSAAIYQRMTGPTYPQRTSLSINNSEYKVKLPTSSYNDTDCKVILPGDIPESSELHLLWRHFPTQEDWQKVSFSETDEGWVAWLPKQQAAGKLEYFIVYLSNGTEIKTPGDTAVVIRFKDLVPNWALIPHITFMFLAMFFSNLMGLESIFKNDKYLKHAWIAFGCLAIGGFILGPIVQKFAFGDLWTGIPFGWDLTDNKTLIAGIGFAFGLWQNHRTGNRYWILFASIVLLLIYLIPHSVLGSELNYESGKVITG